MDSPNNQQEERSVPRKTLLLIDDEPEISIKGAAPLVRSPAARTLEVSTEVIKDSLHRRLLDLSDVLEKMPQEIGGYSPSEITVSFAVTASGEVSLMTVLKGNVGATGTFSVKLTRNN
jgi:hypothetical protein